MKRSRVSLILVGLLVVVLAIFLAACSSSSSTETTAAGAAGTTETTGGEAGTATTQAADVSGQTVNVLGVWGGSELDGFNAVAAGWQDQTGATMAFEGTRDLTATLRARVNGNNPPDIAIIPNPALMTEFANQGVLTPITDAVDQAQLTQDYGQTWIDLGTVNGQLYGVFVKASAKSTVWYDPKNFSDAGYQTPGTWDELISLSDQMVQDGTAAPWSVGLESGGASGWPGTDWIQEIVLHESGPDVYDQWVNHDIPWTDNAIKSAWEKFGTILTTQGYIPGGTQFAVSTSYQDASYLPFESPPKAYMYFLGAFTEGFISAQFPDLTAGQDYDFFPFVTIDSAYEGSVTGSGDIMILFNSDPATVSLAQYLSNASNWEPWAKMGGYTSPSSALDPSVYPSELVAKTAQQLTDAPTFRFDADDMMPSELQNAYFQGIMNYAQNTGNLDSILQSLEQTASGAYQQ